MVQGATAAHPLFKEPNSFQRAKSVTNIHNKRGTCLRKCGISSFSISNNRPRFDPRDNSKSWQVDNESDIWSAWRQYLDDCECHTHCLEKYHVIQCDYMIKCSPHLPGELYEHIQCNDEKEPRVFSSSREYIRKIFDAVDKRATTKELRNAIQNHEYTDRNHKFVEEYFMFLTNMFKTDLGRKAKFSESNYSFYVIWPLVEFVVHSSDVADFFFACGEYSLSSTKEEYKADGVVLHNDEVEICLLEVSGPFGLKDVIRFG